MILLYDASLQAGLSALPALPSLRASVTSVAAQTKWFFAKAKNALRVRNARSKIHKNLHLRLNLWIATTCFRKSRNDTMVVFCLLAMTQKKRL